MNVRSYLLLAVAAVLVMTACGKPGAPLPPSLELPVPVQDLTVSRKGNEVTLSWTPPARTVDAQNVRLPKLGPTLICRGLDNYPMAECGPAAGQVQPVAPPQPEKGEKKVPAPPRVSYTDTLPADLVQAHPTGFATYAVEATNWRGRTAGLSNQIKISLAPALPPPQHIQAEVTAYGIVVEFDCFGPPPPNPALAYKCRLYRQVRGGEVSQLQDVTPGQAPCGPIGPRHESACRVTDNTFQWENAYTYWVAPITVTTQDGQPVAEVEGKNSLNAAVVARDIFPPSVPHGLEAVASGVGQKPFIDLTWTPDTEPDLIGYNVYRQEAGTTAWHKINQELVPSPTFRDEAIAAGHTYTYAVTARDSRGNESPRSQPATEPAP